MFPAHVAAGFPSPADDYIDHLIDHPVATFLVRVSGDSMTGASLRDGDLLASENAAYAPLAITEGLDGVIWGGVTRVIHAV